MRKIFFIFIIINASLSGDLLSLDTASARYMPLQYGNRWVYYGNGFTLGVPFSWFSSYTVNGTVDTLGRRYWTLYESKIQISGNYAPSILGFNRIRYDSLTSNLFIPGSICGFAETIFDSLGSRLNNWCYFCNNPHELCNDTSIVSIFNLSMASKNFFNGQSQSTRYNKNIGITHIQFGELSTSYSLNLIGCVINGILYGDTNMIVGLKNINSEIPERFALYQNYPNPFNPTTKIKFSVPSLLSHSNRVELQRQQVRGMSVRFVIYDILGQEVATLINKELSPGTYEINFDAGNLPSGIYFYKMITEKSVSSKKMLLIK